MCTYNVDDWKRRHHSTSCDRQYDCAVRRHRRAHATKRPASRARTANERHVRGRDAASPSATTIMPDFTRQARRRHRRRQRGDGRARSSSLRLGASEVKLRLPPPQRGYDRAARRSGRRAARRAAELMQLQAPVRIEADEDGNACALWAQPQIIGKIDEWGRASVSAAANSSRSAHRGGCDRRRHRPGHRDDDTLSRAGMSVKRGNLCGSAGRHGIRSCRAYSRAATA